jgi:uncharacterized protein (TIRG00374 family)
MKFRPYGLAGLLVSVLFVYLAVRKVDLIESLQVLSSLDPRWIVASMLVYLLLALPIRGLRWRLILREQKLLSLKEILAPLYVGYMANNVLPARVGELYRAHFLGRRARMSRSGAVASIVIERTFDGLMLVGMVLLLFFLFPQDQFLGRAALVMTLVFLALAAGILFYGFATAGTNRAVHKALGLLPERLGQFVGLRLEFFLKGMRGVSATGGYLAVGLYTVCAWFFEACAIGLVLGSFRISLTLSGFVLVYALSALATALPSGPGYVGPYQYAFVLSLGASGFSEETALAVSLATQFSLFGSVIIIGLALLWKDQLQTQWPLGRRKPGYGDRTVSKKKKAV